MPRRTCCELDRSAHRELSTGDTKCLINVDFLQVPTVRRLVTSLSLPGFLSGRFDYDRYGCRTEPSYLILRDVTPRFFVLTSFSENFLRPKIVFPKRYRHLNLPALISARFTERKRLHRNGIIVEKNISEIIINNDRIDIFALGERRIRNYTQTSI